MDQPQEEEFLGHVAAGTDPLTAYVVASEKNKPQGGGCFVALLSLAALLFALLWK
jgi:hypothetical protein